jgi:hypothetical protein
VLHFCTYICGMNCANSASVSDGGIQLPQDRLQSWKPEGLYCQDATLHEQTVALRTGRPRTIAGGMVVMGALGIGASAAAVDVSTGVVPSAAAVELSTGTVFIPAAVVLSAGTVSSPAAVVLNTRAAPGAAAVESSAGARDGVATTAEVAFSRMPGTSVPCKTACGTRQNRP